MDLFSLIVALTSIQLSSSKEGKISFELNMPTFLNSYFGLDQTQKMIQATVVTSGEKHTNVAFDVTMRNKTRYPEEGPGIVQRSIQREPPKIDLIKIKMQGIDDAISLANAVRSLLPTNLTQIANTINMLKDIEVKHPTLDELVNANKMRTQKIRDFNFHFPKWFANSRRNGLGPIRPMVELGHGEVKSEILTYPENFLVKKLQFLVQHAKKQSVKEHKNED